MPPTRRAVTVGTRHHRRVWQARCPTGQTGQLSPGLRAVPSSFYDAVIGTRPPKRCWSRSRRLHAGHRLASTRAPARLVLEQPQAPQFRCRPRDLPLKEALPKYCPTALGRAAQNRGRAFAPAHPALVRAFVRKIEHGLRVPVDGLCGRKNRSGRDGVSRSGGSSAPATASSLTGARSHELPGTGPARSLTPLRRCGGVRCRAVPAMMDACRIPRLPPEASVWPSCWPSCRWALTWA